tara:strand:+ start:178 stop:2139 length:1962 start_codon:yes stop_codon:yes gene_type:complete
MTIQTLFRNVTLPLPLRLRALPEIDTTATLKTYQSFQIENSLRRTTWFTYDEATIDENVPLPGLLNEYLLKILTDNSMVPRSRSDIYFKDVIILVPALDYLQTLSVIKIPLNQFLKDTRFYQYLRNGTEHVVDSDAFGILNTRIRSSQFLQMSSSPFMNFAQTVLLHTTRNHLIGTRPQVRISPFFRREERCIFCYEYSTKVISSSCNNHFLCLDCMNTYMSQPAYNHPINGLSKKFECPFDGCFHTFDIKAVSDFVDENVKQYLKKHIDSLPEKCGMPMLCQRCGSINIFDLSESSHDFECSECLSDICLDCAIPHVTHTPLKIKIQNQDLLVSRGCLCEGIVDKISLNGWTYGMKKTNGWFLANLSNGEKQIYTVQKRDINIEIVKTTIYSILDRDSPFFTKCGHCSFQIERSEACTELKHCNVSICSLCGYKAAPGEKTINTDHWKTCFRYEDELLEFVGARRQDTHYLHSLRRALHMVRFFEQLSDHNRVEASVYLHELLESSEFVEDKFANAKDFQFGLVAILYGINNIYNCSGEVHFSTLFAAALTELLKSPENILPKNVNLTNGTRIADDEDDSSTEESSEYTPVRRQLHDDRPRSRSRSRSPSRSVQSRSLERAQITNVSTGEVIHAPLQNLWRFQHIHRDHRNT